MSPEPRQLLVPATPYLKLGSFTKASTAVTPPKEWPMTATLVRSRLSCKRERAEESAQTSRGLEVSNWGRKSQGKMSRVSLEGRNAVSHCWCDGLWQSGLEGWGSALTLLVPGGKVSGSQD